MKPLSEPRNISDPFTRDKLPLTVLKQTEDKLFIFAIDGHTLTDDGCIVGGLAETECLQLLDESFVNVTHHQGFTLRGNREDVKGLDTHTHTHTHTHTLWSG